MLALSIILPLSLINNIAVFTKASIIANLFSLSTLLAVYTFNIIIISENDFSVVKNHENLAHFSKIPCMIGVSIFAFEAITIIIHVKNSLEDQSQIYKIVNNVNFTIMCIYISFSVLANIAKGPKLTEIILFSSNE